VFRAHTANNGAGESGVSAPGRHDIGSSSQGHITVAANIV
jgi:hypothetical protein